MRSFDPNMKHLHQWPLVCAVLLIAIPMGSASAQDRAYAQLPPIVRVANQAINTDAPPPQIANIPDVQAQLKVVNRRSQLVVAKTNITRAAVADPSVLDIIQYSPNEISVIGMALGTTTLTLWFDNSPEPLIYLVEVIRDPSLEERARHDYGKLEKKLALLFPNSKIYLIPMSGKIIVKGQARDSEEATLILQIIRGEIINQNGSLGGPQPLQPPGLDPAVSAFNPNDLVSNTIVNMLNIPGEFQIMLRVRIAELNRSMLRRMGVNITALINDGQGFFASLLAGGATAITGGAAVGAGTLTGVFSGGDVSILVNALAANGTTKILAEPNITVLSGHPASFLSGGEFAVPTIVGIGGVGGQQTNFRGFGVSLVVTPTVMDHDRIRMVIWPEFSQINNQNRVNGIPGTTTRRVTTTVELREGQTIALAGLLSHMSETEVDWLPFLGEIPIVGPLLFAAKRGSQDEKELIILVTPELIRPMEADEVPPVPGFEVTHPDNHQFYWNGQTEGTPDQNVYQLAPYGNGSGVGIPVGYSLYNPAPAAPGYAPAATMPFGYSQGTPSNPTPFGPGAPNTAGRYPVPPNQQPNQQRRANGGERLTPIPNRNANGAPPVPGATPAGGRYGGYSPGPVSDAGFTALPPSGGGAVPAGYETPKPKRKGLGGMFEK